MLMTTGIFVSVLLNLVPDMKPVSTHKPRLNLLIDFYRVHSS
ncbi:hypothetical protein OIU79_026726, partial [Salix purpurea]